LCQYHAVFIYLFIYGSTGFELRASCLLGFILTTAWGTPPALCCFYYYGSVE
jgi:hypothetical protein